MARSPERVLVWGAGGHGRVVADLVRVLRFELAGFAERDPSKVGRWVPHANARVILSEAGLRALVSRDGTHPEAFDAIALGIGDNAARLLALDALAGLRFPSLAHPTAVVSPSSKLGRASVVLPMAVVNAGARIGAGVIINTAAVVEHDCRIGEGAHISPGATLAGGVEVGARSWIGAGATVIQEVRIGADVIVGAGAVVIRDVPAGSRVAGVPARPLRSRVPDPVAGRSRSAS